MLIRVSCNHLPAVLIDTPPARAAPARPAPAAQASNTARLRRAAARALPPTAPIASPTPAPRAHRCTAVCDTPSSRAAAHADQPSAISSIARRRTSPGDPHPTRHIDHSSEPVMVQPPPDTTTALSSAKCTFRRRGVQGAEWAGAAVREIVG